MCHEDDIKIQRQPVFYQYTNMKITKWVLVAEKKYINIGREDFYSLAV